ncbi:MAG: hypothetical protein RR512_03880 [Coprobacillus sp.]
MDDFRIKIEKRKKFLMGMTGLIILINCVLFYLDSQYSKGSDKIEITLSFQMGLIVGLTLLALVGAYKYGAALKDDKVLKQLYIKEHDERNTMIKQKMATSVLVTGVILIIIAISVSVYFEPIVAITLLTTLYVLIIIMLIFKVYYCHKY